uniref:G078 VD Superfamily M precursor conopeptide n=1 Tax=Conus geographus TaxID=6491 RepID=X5IGZ3_CONGE|nr:G078_VD_Superfamily_M_precursor_conopeptide [Conus geographus]
MMSKLGVLLTICLLLFPLTALPMDGVVALRRRNAKTDNANPRDVALDDNVLMTNFITATSSV